MPVKKRKTRSVAEAEGTITSIVFGSSGVDETAPNIDFDDTASTSTPNVNISSSANSTDIYTEKVNELKKGQNRFYSAGNLNEEVLRMETGIPTKKLFLLIVAYVTRFKENITYFYGWKVESINFEDQILITLMKLKQNYPNLHLARLFSCSKTTIVNIILTFIHVLHELLFEDIMSHIPSRFKNKILAPEAFVHFLNCRIVIDCTDIEVVTPKRMDLQRLSYSGYRSMNSFKALVGVAPNGVITYVSKLYAGSTSDKGIVQKCGILSHFVAGDLILADKGFLIQTIIPTGVTVNIPPFLEHGKLTKPKLLKQNTLLHVESMWNGPMHGLNVSKF